MNPSSDMKTPSLGNGSKLPSNSSGGDNTILRQNPPPDTENKRNQDKLSSALLLTAATALASISSEQRYERNDPTKFSHDQFSQDLSSRRDLYPAPPIMQKVPYSCSYQDEHDDEVVDYTPPAYAGVEAFSHTYTQPTPNQKSMHFPVKLMHILSSDAHQHILSWSHDGNSFVVKNPKLLVSEVLPKYFKEAKYSSFTRKLHRWGFIKILRGKELTAYFHKQFRRGNYDLCTRITCQKNASYETDAASRLMFQNHATHKLNIEQMLHQGHGIVDKAHKEPQHQELRRQQDQLKLQERQLQGQGVVGKGRIEQQHQELRRCKHEQFQFQQGQTSIDKVHFEQEEQVLRRGQIEQLLGRKFHREGTMGKVHNELEQQELRRLEQEQSQYLQYRKQKNQEDRNNIMLSRFNEPSSIDRSHNTERQLNYPGGLVPSQRQEMISQRDNLSRHQQDQLYTSTPHFSNTNASRFNNGFIQRNSMSSFPTVEELQLQRRMHSNEHKRIMQDAMNGLQKDKLKKNLGDEKKISNFP